MMMIDWTKPIEATDGRKVKLLRAGLKLTTPGACAVILTTVDRFYAVYGATCDGRIIGVTGEQNFRIRNVPVKRERWVNIYSNGTIGPSMHLTQDEADKAGYCPPATQYKRVACVRVEWEE